MKYYGTLIAVSNMEKSKDFYETILEQKIMSDVGEHVAFENGLALQSNYSKLVGTDFQILKKANSFQLYFEVEDIENWNTKLRKIEGLEFLHDVTEYPWGQRGMRFYDFDKHIIEIAESVETFINRFLEQGLSVEETSTRTMLPVEFIKQYQK